MQNFWALGAPLPDPRASGGWGFTPSPPASGGDAVATGGWGFCPQIPKHNTPLQISGYAPEWEYAIPLEFVVVLFLNADAILNKISVTVGNWDIAERTVLF